jgi:hypothetical protein
MVLLVAVRLKYHRLKPGGVRGVRDVTVYEVKEERLTRRSPAVRIE